jgi:hypothetical protein
MPALFAYLIAVALLLGGGYGALSWLAAPEPVKVAVREKPKLPSRDEAKLEARSFDTKSSEASSSEASALARNDSDRAASGPLASGPSQPPSSPQAGPAAAATEKGAQATGPGTQMAASQPSEPAQDHQDAPANTEMARAEIDQPVETPPQAVAPAPPAGQQSALSPATLAKAVRQRHPRQASGRSEKPGIEKSGLAVMTLRTIEFPDGRRVTRLIPYRSAPYRSARALTFDPYE